MEIVTVCVRLKAVTSAEYSLEVDLTQKLRDMMYNHAIRQWKPKNKYRGFEIVGPV